MLIDLACLVSVVVQSGRIRSDFLFFNTSLDVWEVSSHGMGRMAQGFGTGNEWSLLRRL